MKNELQQYCGYKKKDEDEKKSRDVAPHMKIVQEQIYNKIDYAFDKLEIEINLIHGQLPGPTKYESVNDPNNVVEHGQTTPEERMKAEMDKAEEHVETVEGEIV